MAMMNGASAWHHGAHSGARSPCSSSAPLSSSPYSSSSAPSFLSSAAAAMHGLHIPPLSPGSEVRGGVGGSGYSGSPGGGAAVRQAIELAANQGSPRVSDQQPAEPQRPLLPREPRRSLVERRRKERGALMALCIFVVNKEEDRGFLFVAHISIYLFICDDAERYTNPAVALDLAACSTFERAVESGCGRALLTRRSAAPKHERRGQSGNADEGS